MIDLQLRSRGIGGSEIAAILGIDPRRDAFSVWADKLGMVGRSAATGRMRWGKRIEQVIAEAYAEETHQPVVWFDETLHHPERTWQVYTPDAFVGIDGLYAPWAGGLDAKNVALDQINNWGEPGTDAVPEPIFCQCQWYCSGSELPWWDVAGLFGGNDLRIFRVNRDTEIEGALLEEGERFWRDHVLARVPPEPGSTPATVEALRQMFPRQTKDLRFATAEEAALLAELKQANERWDEANARCLTVENRLKYAIGESEGLIHQGWKLTWRKENDSEGPDWEKVARELALRFGLLKPFMEKHQFEIPVAWCQTVEQLAAAPGMRRIIRTGARKLHPNWGRKNK
jgi:predicted phage-related endonuclease